MQGFKMTCFGIAQQHERIRISLERYELEAAAVVLVLPQARRGCIVSVSAG
jgi:hypothetical protein